MVIDDRTALSNAIQNAKDAYAAMQAGKTEATLNALRSAYETLESAINDDALAVELFRMGYVCGAQRQYDLMLDEITKRVGRRGN
jgi:hypothetical protein